MIYHRPPMAHPDLPGVLRQRIDEALARPGIDPGETSVLVVGHGSSRNAAAGDTARHLADALAAPYGAAVAAFLEQPPFVHDWTSLVGERPHVVVVPLLMGEGVHGRDDLPPLFNLDPDALESGADVLGPVAAGGHEVLYLRGAVSVETAAGLALDMIETSCHRPLK